MFTHMCDWWAESQTSGINMEHKYSNHVKTSPSFPSNEAKKLPTSPVARTTTYITDCSLAKFRSDSREFRGLLWSCIPARVWYQLYERFCGYSRLGRACCWPKQSGRHAPYLEFSPLYTTQVANVCPLGEETCVADKMAPARNKKKNTSSYLVDWKHSTEHRSSRNLAASTEREVNT